MEDPGSATMDRSRGIPCPINAPHVIVHNQVMVIGGEVDMTGRFNFTAAEDGNAERLPVIQEFTPPRQLARPLPTLRKSCVRPREEAD